MARDYTADANVAVQSAMSSIAWEANAGLHELPKAPYGQLSKFGSLFGVLLYNEQRDPT